MKKEKIMKFDYVESPFMRALIRKYEYQRDEAIATLNVYFSNPTGISEHSEFVQEMDVWMEKLASADEKLKILISTFAHRQQEVSPEEGS